MAQTYTNWELIVVSDRCTDDTKAIINAYSHKDQRIKYALNDRGKGTSGARNCGMLLAKGDYIAFLDSDDQWYNFHLKDSIDTIREVKSDVSFALWEERHGDVVYQNFNNKTEQQILQNMREQFEVHGNAIVFEKGLLERFLTEKKHFHCITTMVLGKNSFERPACSMNNSELQRISLL